MTHTPEPPDTRPVRPSEQLDWRALELYVREKLADVLGEAREAPLKVEQFPGGHSNLTYLLRFGPKEFVMRRPPFGPVPPRAHDMARECRVLAAVHAAFPLAPRPFVLCEDPSVIGATFYLMERRHGLVVRAAEPPQLKDDVDARRRASAALVVTLAELHRVDVGRDERLLALGKPAGFVARQVRGWAERWRGSQTSELAEMDALANWLDARLPPDPPRPSLVHGDYKLDNVMLDARDVGRVVAVLDWEMSAVGDPLVDLGITLAYWVHTAQAARGESVGSVTFAEGWFAREEILERYAARTGFDLSNVTFYEVFAVFKIAVVLQQIFFRYKRGQTDDPRFATLGPSVAWLARVASDLAGRA
ncbi:MAG TPA: phosphotransferase family protein [Pyrinomonadaceae bacterium]|nr:phosphotransferase family protein [Pyrinomonadaceae bacterium]